jgi:hypothetical protein
VILLRVFFIHAADEPAPDEHATPHNHGGVVKALLDNRRHGALISVGVSQQFDLGPAEFVNAFLQLEVDGPLYELTLQVIHSVVLDLQRPVARHAQLRKPGQCLKGSEAASERVWAAVAHARVGFFVEGCADEAAATAASGGLEVAFEEEDAPILGRVGLGPRRA